jgi:hypothetical protein
MTNRKPPFRKLRGYAFDPSLSLQMETAPINDIIYKVPWEDVNEGPVGEYVEVIDYDPTVDKFYQPVDLNDPILLAQDGLDPSESNPLFHQQMVYAVTMITIRNFEKALGRKVLWASRRVLDQEKYEEPVWRLRIYPHALREANAFYSPLKKALLFGYFASTPADETIQMPDSLIFTCLSHDIITHETTHAILDGLHTFFNEPTNPDMLAFHEAFADIVALFQHFTFPEVLKHQIAKTKGDLATQSLLGQLAQQFGTAIGNYGSLRDAIGKTDPKTNEWQPKVPDANDYLTVMEPHARGSILVAAVFEAFIKIYNRRVADLVRIASEGTGILRQGELHPDLIGRLAIEASKAAGHVLRMCIRALDYCPPVDLTFGDYLRAIITADADLVNDDHWNYRLAFIEAFRRRGIYPENIKTLSVESLRHPQLNIKYQDAEHSLDTHFKEESKWAVSADTKEVLRIVTVFLRDYAEKIKFVSKRSEIYEITKRYITGNDGISTPGTEIGLHERLNKINVVSADFAKLTGLAFVPDFSKLGVNQSRRYDGPSFQIQNLRLVSRVGPDGNQINQVIFSLLQRSGIAFQDDDFLKHYFPARSIDAAKAVTDNLSADGLNRFELRGGCTMIFDLDNLQLAYAISKPLIDVDLLEIENRPMINMQRAYEQYHFAHAGQDGGINEFSLYFGSEGSRMAEPFAFLHQH